MYPVFQLATLFILTLAANTSYSDFDQPLCCGCIYDDDPNP